MSFIEKFKTKKVAARILMVIYIVAFAMLISIQAPQWIKNYREQGQQILSMEVTALDGQTTWVFDKAGKRRLVVFWATWCGPCSIELSRIQSAIEGGDFTADRVIAISLGEELETVKSAVKERGYTFPVFVDEAMLTARQLSVSVTPTVALVEPDNLIYWKSSGISAGLIMRAKSFFND